MPLFWHAAARDEWAAAGVAATADNAGSGGAVIPISVDGTSTSDPDPAAGGSFVLTCNGMVRIVG